MLQNRATICPSDHETNTPGYLYPGTTAHDVHGRLLRTAGALPLAASLTRPSPAHLSPAHFSPGPILFWRVSTTGSQVWSAHAVHHGVCAKGKLSMESSAVYTETLPGGATWSHVLRRGTALRMTDLEGSANVAAYFLNFENPSERFNISDTLKAQHTAKLSRGNVLYSDMGRILCSITEDAVGWHDPLAGISNSSLIEKRYGKSNYQENQNARYQNARDGLVIELGKYGMGPRDLHGTVNFFSKVSVDEQGDMQFVEGNSPPGSYVELRAEMNVLVLLNTCPHPLSPGRTYDPKPVELSIHRVANPRRDDPCRISCPENRRGFILTELYFL
jgi:urea carboxylase-associated protein 2